MSVAQKKTVVTALIITTTIFVPWSRLLAFDLETYLSDPWFNYTLGITTFLLL
jgi:hypothetical protein